VFHEDNNDGSLPKHIKSSVAVPNKETRSGKSRAKSSSSSSKSKSSSSQADGSSKSSSKAEGYSHCQAVMSSRPEESLSYPQKIDASVQRTKPFGLDVQNQDSMPDSSPSHCTEQSSLRSSSPGVVTPLKTNTRNCPTLVNPSSGQKDKPNSPPILPSPQTGYNEWPPGRGVADIDFELSHGAFIYSWPDTVKDNELDRSQLQSLSGKR